MLLRLFGGLTLAVHVRVGVYVHDYLVVGMPVQFLHHL